MFELSSKTQDLTYCITDKSSLYFSCILKNEAAGIIWGNTSHHPNFLLVFSPYQEGFQLMGEPLSQNEWAAFKNWFIGTIIPFIKKQELEYFEFGADTKELADMFQAIFTDYEIFSAPQKIFRWVQTSFVPICPSEYQVEKVDSDFFSKPYSNKDFIQSELERAYGTLDSFFKYGIAYVAIYQNTIVARADMLFSHGGYGNISVNTDELHRRKGLSTLLTMKTIEETLHLGLTPVWDCTDDNLPSEKTALKCGFKLIREDIISWFCI